MEFKELKTKDSKELQKLLIGKCVVSIHLKRQNQKNSRTSNREMHKYVSEYWVIQREHHQSVKKPYNV